MLHRARRSLPLTAATALLLTALAPATTAEAQDDPQGYLKASNPDIADSFGSAVAISGDTVVVGAPRESSDATGVDGDQDNDDADSSGAAYVFTRTGDTWTQQAYLKASNTDAFDYFGWSVAIDGDTIVVGAPAEDSAGDDPDDDSATQSGAAYVFTRTADTWTQQGYLKAPDPVPYAQFGASVAVSRDTVVVGDLAADGPDGTDATGAAYVFTRTADTWTRQAQLRASNPDERDSFGRSVAIDGDTIAVAASWEDGNGTDGEADNSAPDAGAVYVFTGSGSTWTQQAYLKAANADAYDVFGSSIAVDGDTIVVGALGESSAGDPDDNSADASGAAYVFGRTGTAWAQQAYLKAFNGDPNDWLGDAAGISDGTVVVGASGEASATSNPADNTAEEAGAAYVFDVGPRFTVDPADHDYGGRLVGTTSDPQSFTVTNTGNADLSISGVSLTGTDADQFTKGADSCAGLSLSVGATCTVEVAFAPTSTGDKTAALEFTDNAAGSPHRVALTGAGTEPGFSVDPDGRDFGARAVGTTSAPQVFTVTNTGDANLHIDTVSLTGDDAGHFPFTDGTCAGADLAPGATCAIAASFAPTSAGAKSATVTFTDDAPGSPHTIRLTGTGDAPGFALDPTSRDFGLRTIGFTSPAYPFTITNTGTGLLQVTDLAITGPDASAFSIHDDSCTHQPVPAGTSCQIQVTFTATHVGTHAATLTITHTGDGGSATAQLTGAGRTIQLPPSDPDTPGAPGPGPRTPTCLGKKATIVGTNGPDKLRGTPGRDVIVARGGNDVIRALAGNDLICAGAGNDRVHGGNGNDRINGGPGNDLLNGGKGNNRIKPGPGRDRIAPRPLAALLHHLPGWR